MHNVEIFNKCKLCHNGTVTISNVENAFFFVHLLLQNFRSDYILRILATSHFINLLFQGLLSKIEEIIQDVSFIVYLILTSLSRRKPKGLLTAAVFRDPIKETLCI